MKRTLGITGLALLAMVVGAGAEESAQALRLVPFPREVSVGSGGFALDAAGMIAVKGGSGEAVASLIRKELLRAGMPGPAVQPPLSGDSPVELWWAGSGESKAAPELTPPDNDEGYALRIDPAGVKIVANKEPGLYYGVQTLCQLIRANRRGSSLPCLTIRDWPALRWRCFQDDLTRGPSTRLDVLKRQLDLGAFLKHNLFTYYMEHQYAWEKHPVIGPPDGSLTPAELRDLVAHGQTVHIDILGNQQSFGHFAHILKHDEYAGLRETGNVLCPVKEESYRLLDELYSEVVPLLPLPFFNVCCDETYGLGEGPSNGLAQQIGVGGVYARHLRRVHDLLQVKYGKRMMMWGDIILQHPEHLKEIPGDTLMLTWGYGAKSSFDDQIEPFAKSGYEFLVCPGVNNWSRILPDFGTTLTNIRNFVRDGAKHGALGMLNTAWDDDGENLNAPSWHGYAWGAECAWTASATTPEEFSRRIGAVLFGEKGDHFGQAIELLAKTHELSGMQGMRNTRFWQLDLAGQQATTAAAHRLLETVRPAIVHLQACQREAVANADLLDSVLFGVRRMELVGQRILDTAAAAQAYQTACELPAPEASPHLEQAEAAIRKLRDGHAVLGKQFAALWQSENKPYALDAVLNRYANAVSTYDALLQRLTAARAGLDTAKPLPAAREIGLEFIEPGKRCTRPDRVIQAPLGPDAPWLEPRASHRLGLVVESGPVERTELPVEVDVRLPDELARKPVRAFRLVDDGSAQEIPAQLDPEASRLILVLPSRLAKGTQATVVTYLGFSETPDPLPSAVTARDAPNGMKWLENDKIRLLLGPEGAHLYRWEVKALGNRDLTMPGETSWFGFADLGGERRSAKNALVCTAAGPALVRYRCTDALGTEKTVSLYAGASWVEVQLNESPSYFWAFDDPQNFAADGPSPGRYQFSTGAAGQVGRHSDGVAAQVKANGAQWSVKFLPGKLALGLATPGTPARHAIAPGAGAGGVGIEGGGGGASLFVLFGGTLEGDPAARMARLVQTLDFQKRVAVVLHGLQPKPVNR